MTEKRTLHRTKDWITLADGYHLTVIDFPDADSLVKYLNDEEIYQMTASLPHPYTKDDAQSFIQQILSFEKEHGVQCQWAIRRDSGEQIGAIGLLYNLGTDAPTSEIGYWLAKEFWNRGVMTLALGGFCDHIFQTTSLTRLEAKVFEYNEASCRVLEKVGFVKVGYQIKAFVKDGRPLDAHIYALPALAMKSG